MNPSRMTERGVKFNSFEYAVLHHYRLRSNKISKADKSLAFANIEPCYTENVFGILYDLSSDNITELDKKEGYPLHYEKTIVPVLTHSGFKMALTYIATRSWASRNDNPMSAEYRKLISDGITHCENLLPKTDVQLLEQFMFYKNNILKK